MKKMFFYVACALIVHSCSVDLANAWGFGKSKKAAETAGRIFGSSNVSQFLKDLKVEITALTSLTKALKGIESQIITISTDKKAFGNHQDPAILIALFSPLSALNFFATTMLKANQEMESALKKLQKN